MAERYPGYDVLAKRWTPSWNEPTRQAVDARLAIAREPHFLTASEWVTLDAVCRRIVPQPSDRPPAPLAAMVDDRLTEGRGDGYRHHALPPIREAWRRGLAALDAEAATRHGRGFAALTPVEQDALLAAAQKGALADAAWHGMPPAVFFKERVLPDIFGAYYAYPTAWSEIGFGGPASPRGYVRMNANRRDPWEAAEAKPGQEAAALRENGRVG